MTLVRTCCRLISFQTAAAKNFAWEPHWVKWKQSWDFCTFQVHKIEVLRHLRTLPTVTAMSVRDVCRWSVDLVIWLNAINVTEHSSLPSLPTAFAKWLLSSPRCRMETAPGFSFWGVVMLHCGRSCLALISSINKLNQHLFAPAGWCREWCHAARSQIGRCCQFLLFQKPDSWPRSGHTWMRMMLVHTCYVDWFYLRKQLQKNLLGLNWTQIWDFRMCKKLRSHAKSRFCGTCKYCQLSQQRPFEMSANGPQIWWYDSMWSMWLNIVHFHHCPIRLPSGCFHRPAVGWRQPLGFSLWALGMPQCDHCVTSCLILFFPIDSFNQQLFAGAGRSGPPISPRLPRKTRINFGTVIWQCWAE